MVLGALGCMNNAHLERSKGQHCARCVYYLSEITTRHFDAILRRLRSSLRIPRTVLFHSSHAILVEPHQFCMTLDLQFSFYRPMYYNRRAHYTLLQCLHTTSATIAAAHSYLAVS